VQDFPARLVREAHVVDALFALGGRDLDEALRDDVGVDIDSHRLPSSRVETCWGGYTPTPTVLCLAARLHGPLKGNLTARSLPPPVPAAGAPGECGAGGG